MLLRGMSGGHGTIWRRRKVNDLSHEAIGRLVNQLHCPLRLLPSLILGIHALCQDGLMIPGDAVVLGSVFMLREIELAAAGLGHVHVDPSACSFSLKLPVMRV